MKPRAALITGAGRGIGRATALRLAAAGMRVALSARTAAELQAVEQEIAAAGGESLTLRADLSRREDAAQLIERVARQWGVVDVLVNNAGIGSSQDPRPLVDFDDQFWELTMAVNVTAPYLLTKHALPAMLAQNWGRIVNIASINARVASVHGAAYTASKHAVAGLTKATAREVSGSGVTCNAVLPA